MPRTWLCLLSFFILALGTSAQSFRLNGKVRMDTLWVRMALSEGLEPVIRQAYVQRTREGIEEFNKTKRDFVLMETTEQRDHCLTVTIDSVHIATKGQQHGAFVATLFGIALLPTGLILAGSPIVIFFWVNGVSKVYGGFDVSADLRAKHYKRPKIRLNANAGWFKGEWRKRKLVADVYEMRFEKVVKQLHRRLRKR